MGLNPTAIVLGQGDISHPVPRSYVVTNNLFFPGNVVIDSLVTDHCVSGNWFLNGDLYLGGGPFNGGTITGQPFCAGSFCEYCR